MPRLKQIGIDVDVNGVIEKNRKAFSETENAILRRLLKLPNDAARPFSALATQSSESRSPIRQRGLWTVRINERRTAAANLKEAYRTLLEELQKQDPKFLEEFSAERSRSRRYVSRSPTCLFLASPELAKDHAKPLVDGWYFDTNLSAQQVAQRARVAARLCGLSYGRDVQILHNLEEI